MSPAIARLPRQYHPAQLFVDESGTGRETRYLVVGALKFRSGHGRLVTELEQLRNRANWRSEAHFVSVNRTTSHLYREAVNLLAASDARFRCVVLDLHQHDPFAGSQPGWKVHAQLTIAAAVDALSQSEIGAAVVDHLSLPLEVNYENYIRAAVNRQLRHESLAAVCRMDSRACWGLQMADILVGAVAHQYRQTVDNQAKAESPKGKLAAHVADAFGLPTLLAAQSPRFKARPSGKRPVEWWGSR